MCLGGGERGEGEWTKPFVLKSLQLLQTKREAELRRGLRGAWLEFGHRENLAVRDRHSEDSPVKTEAENGALLPKPTDTQSHRKLEGAR